MKSIFLLLSFVLLLLAAPEQKPVKTVVLENFPPHYSLDKEGKPTGFAVDVIEEVAKKAGIKLEYVIVPSWEASNNLFYNTDLVMIVPDSGITPERKQKALFTSPIEAFQVRAFKRTSDDALKNLEELNGRKVGVVGGNSSERLMGYYDKNLTVVYPTKENAFFALLSGEIDVFIYPEPVMEKMIKRAGLENKITAFGKPLKEIKRGIRVTKNAPELAEKLDTALQAFLKSPRYLEIYEKWYGEEKSSADMGKKIQILLIILLILLVTYLIWYFLHTKKYRENLKKVEIEKNILESMFQRHSAIMLLVDPKQAGKIMDANRSATAYYGYSKDELLTMSIEDINILTKEEVEHEMHLAQQEQRNYFLFKHRLKSGEIRDVEVHSTPFISNNQKLLFSIIHDITERNRTQRELLDTKRFVSMVVEESPIGVFVLNSQRIITELNKSAYKMFAYEKEDLLNHPSSILYENEAIYKNFGQQHYATIKTGETVSAEQLLRKKDGTLIWCHITGKAMDKNNLDKGVIWILQNINNEKKQRAELKKLNTQLESKILERTHELQEREKDLRLLIDNLPAMIIYKDTHNNILDLNETTAKILGTSIQEMKGKSISQFTEKELSDTIYRHDLDVIKTKQPKTGIIYKFKVGDEERIGEASKFPILDGNGEVSKITTIIVDITDKLKMEEEKKQHEQMLNQQSRHAALGEMIGAIAHQWRQPLTSLGGILINIQDAFEYGELDEKTLTFYTKDAEMILSYMSNTIDDFRNFFKLNKVKVEFDVIAETKLAMNLLSAQLRAHQVAYTITLLHGGKPSNPQSIPLYGYPNEYKQVILNIVNNAKDAIQNSNTKEGKVDIIIDDLDDKIKITIKDNGGEIPEGILKKIFDPYFTTKHESQGTGLGLYMSKTIVEKNMHGFLRAYNETGWAVFEITVKKVGHGEI